MLLRLRDTLPASRAQRLHRMPWQSARLHQRQVKFSSLASPPEEAGFGVSTEPLEGVSRATLIKAMMNAIDMPERFRPDVKHVSVRAAIGPAADEGALWRSLTLADGQERAEHVYASPMDGEIRFVQLEPGTQIETSLEVVNALHRSPSLRIEHFLRDRHSTERVHWSEPRASVATALEATVRLARAAEAEARDSTFAPKQFPS